MDISGLDLKGGYLNIIPNVNYDNLSNSFIVDENGEYELDENGNKISVLDVPIEGNTTLRQILEKIGAQEDVFLSISVLLSLATDNAKELVLEKINATPDLMGMYIYLLFRGATFADSAKFMTSPIMSLIKEKAKSNIFVSGEADNNIDYSINYYLKGPKLERYVPEKYINSFRNAWIEFKNKHEKLKEAPNDLLEAEITKEFIQNVDAFKEFLKEYLITPNAVLNAAISNKKIRDIEELEYQSALEEMDEDNNLELYESEASETFISSKDNIKILFNRFLNECIKRDNQIDKVLNGITKEELEQSINNIKEIRKGANELTLLGRLSSLNQGIRTQLYEQVNYLSSLTNSIARTLQFTNEELRVLDKLKKGQELNEDESAIHSKLSSYFTNEELMHLINDHYAYKPFDLNEFVNNKETQEFFKHWYKYKSPFVNILDAILTVPHFGEMLKTFTTNNAVLDTLTVRRSNVIEINKELQSLGVLKGGLTPKITNKINRFLTDCIINDYFKTVAPITIPGVTTEYVDGNPIHLDSAEDYIVNFDNLDSRLTFKNWMEEYLINLFRTRDDNFAKNITVKNFQNDLRVPYTMCALDIDMSTMSRDINETRLSDIAIDYSRLYAQTPISNGLTFGDVLFLYNLLMNKNSNSSYAFTNLFKEDLSNSDRIVSKYMKYVSQLSKQDSDSAINYDIKDLVLRLIPLDQEVMGLEKKKSLEGVTEIFYNKTKLDIDIDPIANINTLLFTTDSVNAFTRSKSIQLASDLAKFISNGLVEFKLNCD